MIPYGRQDINQQDIDAVVEVLQSDWLTQGPLVERFEEALCQHADTGYAVTCNSATSALHIACLSLGLGPGDFLWTSPNTFVASANCALFCGAQVDFVDVDPHCYNMSAAALEEKLELAQRNGCLPKIVVPVHFAGHSCDMERIHALSRQYGFSIIEDASHAVGGFYQDRPVGNCCYSDITVYSFHPVKIITSGEGGAALTNNRDLADKMRMLRSHGVTRDQNLFGDMERADWCYEQQTLGFNYRLSDIQCALGMSQLARLNEFVEKRRELAGVYQEQLAVMPLKTPTELEGVRSSWHLYTVQIDENKTALSRRGVFDTLRQSGIGVNVHYIPVHTQPYYRDMGFRKGMYPEAERYYKNAISLPLFPTMTAVQQYEVVEALQRVLS